MKSSGLASNLQPSGAKADALREEMEEAANRVEICRVLGLLLPQGCLWAPRLWGKLQPLLSPCSASSFPPACAVPSPGWSPSTVAVGDAPQPSRTSPAALSPPSTAQGAGWAPIPWEPILAGLSTEYIQPWHCQGHFSTFSVLDLFP